MKKFVFPLAVALLLLALSLVVYLELPTEKSSSSKILNFFSNKQKENPQAQNTQNPQAQPSSQDEPSSQTSQSEVQNQECAERQISYSINGFLYISNCLEFEIETCTMQNIICSLDLTNLDHSTSGQFTILFEIVSADKPDELLHVEPVTTMLAPRETQNLQASIIIEDENADKELTCSFSSEEVLTTCN